jgi:hypothetical protein
VAGRRKKLRESEIMLGLFKVIEPALDSFADQLFFIGGHGHPAMTLAANIYNPEPQAGTLNVYTQRAQWFNCSDTSQPGIAAITNYLNSLPYDVICSPIS